MTVRATKFTPEVLLSAPRRSAGVPNWDGSRILYSVSTYSFESHSKSSEIRVLAAANQESTVVTTLEGASEPNWLLDDDVLILAPGEKGKTKVLVGKVDDFEESHYAVGEIDGPASNVKVKQLDENKFAITVTAQATPEGTLYNPETEVKPKTSGRVYKSMYVRHWDTYVTKNRNAIWYGQLTKFKAYGGEEGRYGLSVLTNALKGTKLESPIPPFGGGDHYDLGPKGIVFAAKDPELNPALNTKCNIYIVKISDFSRDSVSSPVKVNLGEYEGATTSPVFSPSGTQAAFLAMKENKYEADRNHIFVLPDISNPDGAKHISLGLDVSPSAVAWGSDVTLYFTAEQEGVGAVFYYDPSLASPLRIFGTGTVSEIRPLREIGKVFASGSSLIDNSTYYLLNGGGSHGWDIISSASHYGKSFGLSRRQVDDIWWDGAKAGTRVHAIVVKPSDFDYNKKYPLAYLIHGGPQGAWGDSWSTRWNPAVFAEQGYVVVCPNPTGSTGYGQELTDAIQNEWGGLPYQDLVNGFDYIEHNLSWVDTQRAVALGASYGGYMINWIQGHDLGRKFKALVCHDGVFSMPGQMASEELYFPFHEFNGSYWERREAWEKWDPSRFTANWSTPQLVIHSELDYRLTISEGLAAFHTLQARGVESQFLVFPDENHWVLKPENSLLWHVTVLDWINEHVGLPKYSESSKFAKRIQDEGLQDHFEKLKV